VPNTPRRPGESCDLTRDAAGCVHYRDPCVEGRSAQLGRGSGQTGVWSDVEVDAFLEALVRYLEDGKIHHLGGGNVYVITVLDCYSRAVLASAISRTQDLTAYLMVLFAAIRQHGSPERLVSDSGSIFYGEAGLARRSAAVWLYRETRQSSSRISPSRSTLSRTSPTTPTCSA